jgi:hypothetical protein
VEAEAQAALLELEQEAARIADEGEIARLAAIALESDDDDLQAAQASALLVELSAEPLAYQPAEEVQTDDDAADEPDTDRDDDDDLYPMHRNEDMADTAALLRELSSLGNEESDPDPAAGAQSPRPMQRPNAGNDKKQRKKIGLFGL